MPETIRDKTVFSLTEVARSIRKTIAERYRSAYWVKAELNKLNLYSHSGHCYPELMEKEKGKVTSQMRSTLWKEDYQAINKRFLEVLKEPLRDGIKILFLARLSFDPVHGLSLRIIDIDPSYTLGDLEREKQDCIDRLIRENIFDLNKQLSLPLLPRRIAVISVETSKGYADFIRLVDQNLKGYRLFHHLFPAFLQGEKAVGSIIRQLTAIRKVKQHFDMVAIIRGGGDDIGLSCYNSYELAKEVALFPLPVLTGIGHATNETVVELVAFANEITPTRLAESLLERFNDFAFTVRGSQEKITMHAGQRLRHEQQLLDRNVLRFQSNTFRIVSNHRRRLKEFTRMLIHQTRSITRNIKKYILQQQSQMLSRQTTATIRQHHLHIGNLGETLAIKSISLLGQAAQEMEDAEATIGHLHPDNVLKRGYSITHHRGVVLKSSSRLKEGDVLETTLFEGKVQSKTIFTVKTKHHE